MKATLFAALLVAGLGLIGTASAAPISGAAIGDTIQLGSPLQQVQGRRFERRIRRHRHRICRPEHFRHGRTRMVCRWVY